MITAKARHWVNYNGTWHPKGDEFPIDDADIVRMQKYADIKREPDKPEQQEPQEPQEAQEPAKRGRKRKE